tara:strand:+ start:107 stop:292 length:186 start_codon:yes stop_codon:yes gene_type:complete
MGKHLKTQMDVRFINSLAIEVFKLDPKNSVLNSLMNLPNYEGGELKKTITNYKKKNEFNNL